MSADPKRLADLESHSAMLGRIAVLVESWAISEECTTEDAVKLVVAEALEGRAAKLRREVEERYGL